MNRVPKPPRLLRRTGVKSKLCTSHSCPVRVGDKEGPKWKEVGAGTSLKPETEERKDKAEARGRGRRRRRTTTREGKK